MPWVAVPQWPASWVHPPAGVERPWVGVFRRVVRLDAATRVRFALTADERCELWVDGVLVDRGPDRGDQSGWNYATYDAELAAGDHVFAVRVFALGGQAPAAQVTVRPGVLVAGFDAANEWLSTGVAEWEWRAERRFGFVGSGIVGADERVDFRVDPAEAVRGEGDGWTGVVTGEPGNNGFVMYPAKAVPLLTPSLLLAQRRDAYVVSAPALVDGAEMDDVLSSPGLGFGEWPLTVPARSRRRVLVDLGVYRCGRVAARVRGGRDAKVAARWTEAVLFGEQAPESLSPRKVRTMKGRRDAWEDGVIRGITDEWILDGAARELTTLWWRAGRFVLLTIETGDEAVVLERLAVEETGYPFAVTLPDTGDARWNALAKICLNVLAVCAHETVMDCPYYEQLAYAGDSRVQFLCWMKLCPGDTALMRHALRHFGASALKPGGWVSSSAPSRGGQTIPTFPLWWVAIGADFVAHTGDVAFVRPLMPTMRAMVERWLDAVDPELGLARSPDGWNFADTAFPAGVPAGGMPGEVSGVLNAILAHGLLAIEALERACGEVELAERYAKRRRVLVEALMRRTWDAKRGVFVDAPGVADVSEQMQSLMLLLDETPAECVHGMCAWLRAEGASGRAAGGGGGAAPQAGVTRCQVFFSFYLFEACRRHGLDEVIERALKSWWALLDEGFTTTPEAFGETRSDAHAWGAFPILLVLDRAARAGS